MKIYNGMSGKQLRDWRKQNRLKAIEEMKKEAALHPPVELSPEDEKAVHEMIQKIIDEAIRQ